MNRRLRPVAILLVCSLPLVILGIMVAMSLSPKQAPMAWIGLWIMALAVQSALVWRLALRPQLELIEVLGTTSILDGLEALIALERDAANQRLRADDLERSLAEIANGISDGLLVIDAAGELRLANPMALRFCGASSFDGRVPIESIVSSADALDTISSAIEGDRPAAKLIENDRGFWELNAHPSAKGCIVLIVEIGLVRRAEDLRRTFVQDLSHELRSPLTALRIDVESLEDEIDEGSAKRMVRQIERLTRLIEELRELASIEAGELELDPERVDLSSLSSDVIDELDAKIRAAGVEVRQRLEIDELVCDRRALARILRNLIDNAITYNRPGGWIEISTGKVLGGIELVVSDNGVGIPRDEIQAVFQRLYRLDQARTPGSSGLGLGLAIVKHLAERIGASLRLESREHEGTRVVLLLPDSETAEQETP